MKKIFNFQFLIFYSKAFTLIEMLVVVAVIASVGVILTQIFVATSRTNTKIEVTKDVKQAGDFAVEVIERLIREATGVTSACSDSGTTSASIDIRNSDNNTTTIGCAPDGAVTRIASTSASKTDYLTSGDVTLGGVDCDASTLAFICTAEAGHSATIEISFSLSQVGTPQDQFEKASAFFQTSVTMRN